MSEHTPTKTPPRRRRAPTEVAGHRLLRPLEGSHATWEIPSDDPERVQLLVLGRARKGQERAARTAFHRQLHARTSLLHPHLAAVVGGGESPRGPYVVVSLPRSRPLSSLIAEGPLEPERTYRLLIGVADALDAAHTRWLIHTDLTPRAVFVESGPRDWAWLTDFGIAHNRPPLAFARAGYRSPEELRGEPPLPESNVYSLACIVYTCLSGSAPFARQSSRAAMEAQLNETPPRLTDLRPELPAAIDAVLATALSKTPEDRQGSAGALVRDVGAALGLLDEDRSGGRRNGSGRFRRRPADVTTPVRRQKPVALNGAPPAVPLEAPKRSRHAPGRSSSTAPGAAPPAAPRPVPARPKHKQPPPARPKRPTPIEALPPRRRARRGAPPVVLIPVLLLAVAGAGLAGWMAGGSDPSTTPQADPAARQAERAAERRAEAAARVEAQRVAWLASANDAVEALNSRRAADRRRLAAARTPGDQAARARRLARSYALTRRSLGDPPASVPRAAALAGALRRAEASYGRLARSASNENRSAYRRAVDSVRSAEGSVDRALVRLGEPS
jgi:serine/threonine protein kinase